MDHEALISPQNATYGLFVLAAIPVAVLALWADYFERYLEELVRDEPAYDPAIEHQTIRLAGLVAIFLQALLFLASAELRRAVPLYLHFLPLVGVSLQAWIQSRVEAKLRSLKPQAPSDGEFDRALEAERAKLAGKRALPPREYELPSADEPESARPAAPKPVLGLSAATPGLFRAFIWSLVAGTLYATLMLGSLVLAAVFIRAAGLSPIASTLVMITSAGVGVLLGLAVNFAFAPYFMRKVLDARPAESPEQLATVAAVFARAGLRPPRLYLIDPSKPFAGAIFSGFRFGTGILTPALFITRSLSSQLSPPELAAVFAHEASHLALGHLKRRLGFAVTLILATAATATVLVLFAFWALEGRATEFIGLASGLGAFLSAFHFLREQSRRHEIESDRHCVTGLGIPAEDLISALRKLDSLNTLAPGLGDSSLLSGLGHPATDERVRLIQEHAAPATDRKDRAA